MTEIQDPEFVELWDEWRWMHQWIYDEVRHNAMKECDKKTVDDIRTRDEINGEEVIIVALTSEAQIKLMKTQVDHHKSPILMIHVTEVGNPEANDCVME